MQPPPQDRRSEQPEPREQLNPVPRIVLGLALGLVVWAMAYIFVAHPDAAADLGDRRPPQALTQGTAGAGTVDGGQLFVAKCQACHQANGQGLPGVFPPLAGSSWVKETPDFPIQIVLHGLNGPVDVAGATYNGAMPTFADQMTDAELAALLSFIRGAWGNAAPAVDAARIAAERQRTAGRNAPWNGIAELQSFLTGAPAKP
jgi:mono/diheme cytochrome c family protein